MPYPPTARPVLRWPEMTKWLLILLLALGTLVVWRARGTRRLSRPVPPSRRDAGQLRNPLAGVLFAIMVTFILLFALFLLPGLMDRLP
jgi:hypothetical protein